MNARLQDSELLEEMQSFVLSHPSPLIEPFRPAMRDLGTDWQAVEPTRLNVTDDLANLVEKRIDDCDSNAVSLLQAFARHNHRLHWEQSYRREEGLVPERMLDSYGFAEIIGLRGPLVSDRIRAGIAIWGANIDYPQHHHQAREAYILLCGSARFQFADRPPETRRAGDVVFIESNLAHGFRTTGQSLVLCYLWQGGDLRQTSHFS